MKLSGKRLQVWHYPQLPGKPFKVDVKDEYEAIKIINILADQHIWLLKNKFIPDYNNEFLVMMEENGKWVEYNHGGMAWVDFETLYENEIISSID